MSKIRVLSDQLANQIAAGEVIERPASVSKELVENAIDAGARRIEIEMEAGGRRLLRVSDDGEGMARDDAVLAFERHATSKIGSAADLNTIATLGFRGEALASIAAVARVELTTKTAEAVATRVLIEGGRLRDVNDAAHPKGTTISVRDLFFNVPARRKFMRSEATESFHLTNLVTHYALAHPEIAFVLTNNGRETLHAAPARDLRERAYQIFGADFIENLLEVSGGNAQVARVSGFVSAPRERRTSRDAQYLFINGRYVRDRLVSRALSEGYRGILPQGAFPAAILFLDVPLEEVDVNVHPAKTEVRFRRIQAVSDAVREAVRASLARAGYVRAKDSSEAGEATTASAREVEAAKLHEDDAIRDERGVADAQPDEEHPGNSMTEPVQPLKQEKIAFGFTPANDEAAAPAKTPTPAFKKGDTARDLNAIMRRAYLEAHYQTPGEEGLTASSSSTVSTQPQRTIDNESSQSFSTSHTQGALPPLASAANLVREVPVASLSSNIRALGQLEDSYIVATDDEGLLLIDQHAAHERILFDKYHALEGERRAESQNLLMPETFDLTPAQAIAFGVVAGELEAYGFALMRLSGRTVAIKAVPAELQAGDARGMLADLLNTMSAERRAASREAVREQIAATLACRAAIKTGTPLAPEKMRWLIDRLLLTSSPTICTHGGTVILRLATRDIRKGFSRV